MGSPATRCACNCQPCVCAETSSLRVGGTGGCLEDFCLPERPRFFDGQGLTAADLNAVVAHAEGRNAALARFAGGWGILGGLRVDAISPGVRTRLGGEQLQRLTNNPQIIAGTKVVVSPGVAIDALGRHLVVCDPVVLDIAHMAQQTPQGTIRTATCRDLLGPTCEEAPPFDPLPATEFFLIAELVETPSRPVPKFPNSGSCDPAPQCDFSRQIESVRFSLVTTLPGTYQFTGCLAPTEFDVPDLLLPSDDPDVCRTHVFAFIDHLQEQLAQTCCERPAIVLAKVALTRAPGGLAQGLPPADLYTIVSDGYPCRKPTLQSGLLTRFFPNTVCSSGGVVAPPALPPPGTILQMASGQIEERVTFTTGAVSVVPASEGTPFVVRLPRVRQATSPVLLLLTFHLEYEVPGQVQYSLQVDDGLTLPNGDVAPGGTLAFRAGSGESPLRISHQTSSLSVLLTPDMLGTPRAHDFKIHITSTDGTSELATGGEFLTTSMVVHEIAATEA